MAKLRHIMPIATTFFRPKLSKYVKIRWSMRAHLRTAMQLFITFPTVSGVQTLCCAIWGAAICHAWCPKEDWSTKEAPASIVHDQTFLASSILNLSIVCSNWLSCLFNLIMAQESKWLNKACKKIPNQWPSITNNQWQPTWLSNLATDWTPPHTNRSKLSTD